MKLLVTTAHPSLHEHRCPESGDLHPNLGRLLQPRHTSSCEKTAEAGITWAADNDAFVPPEIARELGAAAWDADKARRWLQMIERIADLPGCEFVTVPDVVADAAETMKLFEQWHEWVVDANLPVGFVAQNGLADTGVPWEAIDALFIGGDDEFKLGEEAAEWARQARDRGKWVHWGRVNSRKRMAHILATGAADSCDGSSWARFRNTHLDKGLRWIRELTTEAPQLALAA